MATDQELLQQAFSALLRGDTGERDRLLQLLRGQQASREHATINAYRGQGRPIQLVKQSDGSYAPAKSHQH